MEISQEKQKRLAQVARRYYLDNRKQSEIASELGVSRPLISRMLAEARDLGIVEITVHEPGSEESRLLERLCRRTSVRGGLLTRDGTDDYQSNRILAEGAVSLLEQLKTRCLGVGWGHFIGQLVSWLEENPLPESQITDVCPLVGNAGVPIRHYQSNENVRLLAQHLGAEPHFLYLPALPESLEEKEILCSTEVYRQICRQWERMDTALVNIGNFPSTPDFASVARYGPLLHQQRACGRMLVYYFNEEGTVLQSEQDFAIQIPVDLLRRCPSIVGVCSANTSVRALRGALRTGCFTHIVARAALVREMLEDPQ